MQDVIRRGAARSWPVVLLTALAVLPGLAVALTDGGPSVFRDEELYRDNAAAIAGLGRYGEEHYPPVYPAVLAAAYVTEHWFRAMLLVNVVVGAAIVPATWFLARALGLLRPWIPALLVALLPFHGAFAGYLLSENAALPVFVLSVALAVRGRRRDAPWVGLALAVLHLTRFLFLPMVLVLAAVWVLRVLRTDRPSPRRSARRPVRPFVVAAVAYLVPLAAWAAYGMLSGHAFGELWGFQTVQKGVARPVEGGQLASVMTWATEYTAYLLLAAPVAWALIAVWVAGVRPTTATLRRWTPVTAFGTVTAVTALGYVALASAHSRGAAYNVPEPSHMQGRYMMHVVPVVVVAGCVALERLVDQGRSTRLPLTAGCAVGTAALAWTGWWVLFRGGLWGVPAWGATMPFNAVDLFVLRDVRLVAVVAAATVVVPLLAHVSVRAAAAVWAAAAAVVLVVGVVQVTTPPINGARSREIAAVLADRTALGDPVTLWLPDTFAGMATVGHSLRFWGVDTDLVTLEPWASRLDADVRSSCVVPPGAVVDDLWVDRAGLADGPVYRASASAGGFTVHQVSAACMAELATR